MTPAELAAIRTRLAAPVSGWGLATAASDGRTLLAAYDELAARIQRTLDTHVQDPDLPEWCEYCAVRYPCPTRKALSTPDGAS